MTPRRRAAGRRRVAARAGVLLMAVETTREVLLGCLSVPRWADDVLAGQPVRRPGRAHRRAPTRPPVTLTDEELDQALSGHPRIGERGGCAVAAGAGRRRPRRRGHRSAARGRQRGVRGTVRPGLPDPGRRPRRRGDPGRARPAAAATTTRPSAPRPSTTCARSRCSAWRRCSDEHPLHARPRHRGRPAGARDRRTPRDPRRRRARRGRHRRRRPGRLASVRRRWSAAPTCSASTPAPTSTASTPRSSSCSPSPTDQHYHVPAAAQPLRLLDLPWQLTSIWSSAPAARSSNGAEVAVVVGDRRASGSPRDVVRRGRRPRPGRSTLEDDEVLLPGLVDTHVHVNEPGRTEWEGFATATRAAAAGGVTTILDMPLNSIPATTTVAALELKRPVRRGAGASSTSASGAVRCPTTSPTCAPLHEAGVFGFKCFLLDSGVAEFPPPRRRRRSRPAMEETARLGALMIVHAEDGAPARRGARSTAPTTPASSPRGRAPPRRPRSTWSSSRPARPAAGRTSCTCQRRRRRTRCSAAARAAGVDVTRRDLPALPDLRRRAHRRRRHRVQVLPADPRGRQPRGAVGGAGRGRHRLRRLRPLAVHGRPQATTAAATSARPGAASRRCSSACRRCGPGPARAATRSPTWCAGWPPRRPTGSGSPDKGRIEVGADADLVRFAPDEEFIVDVARLHAPQPGLGVRRPPAGRRGPRDLAARRARRGQRRTSPEDDC